MRAFEGDDQGFRLARARQEGAPRRFEEFANPATLVALGRAHALDMLACLLLSSGCCPPEKWARYIPAALICGGPLWWT
jgi:hypothetical protein